MLARRVRRAVVPLVLAGALAGCGSLPETETAGCGAMCHVLLTEEHPWHTGPALLTSAVVFVPLALVAAPFALLEPDASVHSGVVPMVVFGIAIVPGLIVGGVFYVALYPLEWVFPVPEPPAGPVEIPEDLRRPHGPAPEPAADPSRP